MKVGNLEKAKPVEGTTFEQNTEGSDGLEDVPPSQKKTGKQDRYYTRGKDNDTLRVWGGF